MRIALVSDFSYPYTKGGVETRYYTLARYLLDRGHSVTWFTSRQWKGAAECNFKGIVLVGLCQARDPFDETGKRSKKEALLFGLAATKILATPHRFDVVDVSQYPFFHVFPIKLYSVMRRVPIVMSWYEFWGDYWFEYAGRGPTAYVGRWVEAMVASLVRDCIPDSEQARDRLIAAGCDPRRVQYVPLAVDIEHIGGVVSAGDPCDIVYFGRLKGHKNVDSLIHAIALCRRRGLVLRTKICGDGPERRGLEGLVKELGLTEQVSFLGRIEHFDDLIAQIKTARLFVHPSTKEGGGSTTLIEANACGLPVVVVRHPLGFDESLVEEGTNGFWSSSQEPPELARAIQRFFSLSDEEQAYLQVSSSERARRYDVQVVYRRIEEIYSGLVAGA